MKNKKGNHTKGMRVKVGGEFLYGVRQKLFAEVQRLGRPLSQKEARDVKARYVLSFRNKAPDPGFSPRTLAKNDLGLGSRSKPDTSRSNGDALLVVLKSQ